MSERTDRARTRPRRHLARNAFPSTNTAPRRAKESR